jgi:hypothetical protein
MNRRGHRGKVDANQAALVRELRQPRRREEE